ncbi:MAG: hypothetical protein LM558_05080 [Thermosphaera sp.]|jgi:hypothetical protein|nr:hypothetical protein [Thermosphaera sp.]
MPLKTASTQIGFTVSGVACPEGSECLEVDECLRAGGACIEGTAGCGGLGTCCCAKPKPPVKLGPLILAVGAMAFFALAYAYELWKIARAR